VRLPIRSSVRFEEVARGAQFRDRIAIPALATPVALFEAFETVALPDMKLAWLLGEIRYLPARLSGHQPNANPAHPFLSTLLENGTLILHDDKPHEIMTGSAGQLHRLIDQVPVRFASREAFDRFADPRYEKLFMSIRVSSTGADGEQWLVLEHATLALSADAERKFRKYWRVIRPMGAFVSRELLRATRDKARRLTLPP